VLRARAHYLCGSAGALGLMELSALGRAVDEAIKANLDHTGPTAQLATMLVGTIAAVEAFLPKLSTAA
jgi:hypothetical protein